LVPDSSEIRARFRSLVGERRQFGYWRLGVLPQRKGIVVDTKQLLKLNTAGVEPALVAGSRL
jgi:hypothetical protein